MSAGFKISINLKKRTLRPLEPEGVVGGKRRKHQSDEPTTPTREKKRKRRIVDDLHYSCKIDTISESEVVNAISSINYSINNLVCNILYAAKEFKLLYPSPKRKRHRASDTNLDTPLQFLLDESAQLSNDAMGLVVEIILLNLIFTLLHKHFFSGEHFFGVGSDTLYEYLETMLSKLVAGENSDPTAIQRWRSMTVEAIFQMNDGIDSQLNKELSSDLIRLLKIVFPCSLRRSKKSKQSYKEIIRGEQQSILDVIRQARRLSLMIQHNIVSCQLLVTVASTSQSSSDGEALGTRAFGLKRITGSECTVLMKTELITTSLLQSLLQNTTS